MHTFIPIATLVAALVWAPQAQAHAFLDRAMPAVGSTIHVPPTEVRLRFSEELEPAFSTIRVLDKNGVQVDKMDKHVDRADPAILSVSLPPLAPGTYRVVWRVLSVDTHVTKGDFSFDLAP